MSQATAATMRKLIDRGLEGVELLPIAEQIALHEAAAAAFVNLDSAAAELADYTAASLRLAERHQLKFRELLKS